MGFFLVTISSFFAASYNFCMRKSVGHFSNAKSFLMIELWFAALFSIAIHPARSGFQIWNGEILTFGILVGMIFGYMLYFLGQALEKGPAGLTIAGLNSSNVLPSIFMCLIFGTKFGFSYNVFHALGSLLVMMGIFWASFDLEEHFDKKSWGSKAFLAIFLHVFFLLFMQWRALMINLPDAVGYLRLFSREVAKNPWFTPAMYISAALVHTAIFFRSEKRAPSLSEYKMGMVGGIFNALYAFFLIWSSEKATTFEHAMLFPMFSVFTILLCNLWGKWIYQESIHWKACHLSLLGLVLGTVDWQFLTKYLRSFL